VIYIESATRTTFKVTDSAEMINQTFVKYDDAFKFAMKEAEFAKDHLVIIPTDDGRIQGDLIIIGHVGIREIRSVISVSTRRAHARARREKHQGEKHD
jgi:hypothetical protein